MSTATVKLDTQRTKHLDEISTHQKEIARAEKRLAAIKQIRSAREHGEKVLIHDGGAIHKDEQLAQEHATLTREISTRRSLIEDSQRAADGLDPQIEQARIDEAVELGDASAVNWENQALAFSPLFESFAAELKQFETGRAGLEAAIRNFPEWAQLWLGKYYLQNLVDKFNAALFAEMNRVIIARGKSGSDFLTASSQIFSNVGRAFATIGATAARGGPGRTMYRAVGGVNGVSGGLTIAHGDLIALPNDAETQKLISSGALIEVNS
jgi:hypothetical protein